MSTGGQTVTFSIDRLHPGTTLGGPIYEDSEGGVLLLQAGVCVSEEQIDQLKNRGIKQIRIERRFADSVFSSAPRRAGNRPIRQRNPTTPQAQRAEKSAPPICRPE